MVEVDLHLHLPQSALYISERKTRNKQYLLFNQFCFSKCPPGLMIGSGDGLAPSSPTIIIGKKENTYVVLVLIVSLPKIAMACFLSDTNSKSNTKSQRVNTT